MPQDIPSITPDDSYTPEFKLQVVLEYLRMPKRKKQICQEYQIREELLEKWHQQFLGKARQMFAEMPPPNPQIQPPDRDALPSKESTISAPSPRPTSGWGIRFNRGLGYPSPSSSREPPAWLVGYQLNAWKNEKGMIVWNDATQKLQRLYGREALALLQKLRQTTDWRTNGISITRHAWHSNVAERPKLKPSRKKAVREERAVEAGQPEGKLVEEECMRLPVHAGAEMLAFLENHEDDLKKVAADEEKCIQQAFEVYWTAAFKSARDEETRKIDLSNRALPWVYHAETRSWVCDLPPNRGTIKEGIWHSYLITYIEQPGDVKKTGPSFAHLEQAMEWTEQQLRAIPKTAAEPISPRPAIPANPPIDLTPYWIEPTALEPERITYRIVIELEHEPESFKTAELSSGKVERWAEKFPSPTRVAQELRIQPAQATVEWPMGFHGSSYFIYSTAIYFQETITGAQAQQLWDQSEIQNLYRAGRIKEARYGYEEIETGYWVWLGGLPNPERPWSKQKTRAEYMTECALEDTIVYALDLDRFREKMGGPSKWNTDENLLNAMHTRRARSKHMPATARAESEQWLREHGKKKHSS